MTLYYGAKFQLCHDNCCEAQYHPVEDSAGVHIWVKLNLMELLGVRQ